jgi:ParB family chromosome partitioning protein
MKDQSDDTKPSGGAAADTEPTGASEPKREHDVAALDGNPVEWPIDRIKIPPARLQTLGDLSELKHSIEEIGVLAPVLVRADGTLIAGAHRVEASRQLNRQTIPVHIVLADDVVAEVMEIDENLVRKSMSVLTRAEKLARRKELFEIINPQARRGAAPGKAGGGKAKRTEPTKSFLDDTAARTGMGRSTVAETERIGRLPADVREKLRGTEYANQKTLLVKLSKLNDVELRAAVDQLLAPKPSAASPKVSARPARDASPKLRASGDRKPEINSIGEIVRALEAALAFIDELLVEQAIDAAHVERIVSLVTQLVTKLVPEDEMELARSSAIPREVRS